MMREEFDTRMIERFGWTFPASHYPIIEKAYMAHSKCTKDEFVEFAGTKDMNGIELMARYGSIVYDLYLANY